MLFLIIIGLFFAAIVFFHMIQGFFSATLSAIFCVVAAVVAVSYSETIIEKFLGGGMADYATSLMILMLFAVVYLILRIVFDNLVPGNVRVPSGLDKAGAVVMGVIAAVFATGIMAIAGQALPFETSIGGFARYDVQEARQVVVPGARARDAEEYDELSAGIPGKFGPEGTGHGVPLLPVDNIVMGAVQRLSDGPLSSGKPIETIHPDYLDELFGQRMGVEPGASHVAMNLPNKRIDSIEVKGLYALLIPTSNQRDGEFKGLRTGGALKPIQLTPSSKDEFLVVRVLMKTPAGDHKDHVVRFSPGSVRLVGPAGNGDPTLVDYYPVGTMQNASILYLNKPDDFLYVQLSGDDPKGVDLVYEVPRQEFDQKAPPGSFLEFKRLARVDLNGTDIESGAKLKRDENFNPVRKPAVIAPPEPPPQQPEAQQPAPAPTPAPGSASTPTPTPTPAAAATVGPAQASVSNAVPVTITAPTGSNGSLVSVPGGVANVTDGKLKMATIDSTAAEQTQPMKVTQFLVPDGQAMVQVTLTPNAANPWQLNNEPDQYELVDSGGKHYPPNGLFAVYDKGGDHFYLRFVDGTSIPGAAPPEGAGAPKQVVLLYVLPAKTQVTEFDDHSKKASDLNVAVK